MKANELRIGNYIKFKSTGDIERIYNISNDFKWSGNKQKKDKKTADINDVDISDVQAIPLTEEWLLKFGFVEENYSYVKGVHQQVFSGLMKFDFNERLNNWEFSIGNYNDLTRILYVHQLQNLYFALTGEELIIKS